ncbi:MAG: hypothetical protein HQL75_10145 [Magnetococcales bacterium]|nr:hypothetical protein [Magnetococcales bacterium]
MFIRLRNTILSQSDRHKDQNAKTNLRTVDGDGSNLEKLEPRVEYYIVRGKMIIRFHNDLAQSLMRNVRVISKQINQCDEIVLDMSRANCKSMTGIGILTYILNNSPENRNKLFSVVTNDVDIMSKLFKGWGNIKVVKP